MVEELLELHCKKCEGLWYGCNSCAERTAIVEILKKTWERSNEFAIIN